MAAKEVIPARNFSGRTVAFLVVVFIAAVIMAPSLRVFLTQQQELAEVQAEIDEAERLNEELRTELNRWDDPAFVQQQARERFNMVMPGERKYMVTDPTDDDPLDPVEEDESPLGWADDLWGSLIASSQQ